MEAHNLGCILTKKKKKKLIPYLDALELGHLGIGLQEGP